MRPPNVVIAFPLAAKSILSRHHCDVSRRSKSVGGLFDLHHKTLCSRHRGLSSRTSMPVASILQPYAPCVMFTRLSQEAFCVCLFLTLPLATNRHWLFPQTNWKKGSRCHTRPRCQQAPPPYFHVHWLDVYSPNCSSADGAESLASSSTGMNGGRERECRNARGVKQGGR